MSGGGPEERRYALELDPGEVERYRMMAEQARAAEADLWDLAGIGPGASVADVGCGPGAMLPALSDAGGTPISSHFFGQSSFATHSIASERT